MRTAIVVIFLNVMIFSSAAQAQEAADMVYRFDQGDGMVSTMTVPYRGEMVNRLELLRDRIEERCAQLERRVEKAVLTPARVLFAAIMPGGLLLTAITRERGRQARKELTSLSQELEELGGDLQYWTAQQEVLALAHTEFPNVH